MAPPAVQDLNTLIGQYTSASAPQSQALDEEEQTNESSGDAQTSGLNAAKDSAFGQITQNANNRGELFSGFTPDAQAKYTASTYLPALAKVQGAIANTRDTILGKKADLQTTAEQNALTEQQNEQKDLDTFNAQKESEAAAAALETQKEAESLKEAQLSSGPSASQTAAQQQAADFAQTVTNLKGASGKDGFVSPAAYNKALSDWLGAGYSATSFKSNFSTFANPNQQNLYGNNGKNPYQGL